MSDFIITRTPDNEVRWQPAAAPIPPGHHTIRKATDTEATLMRLVNSLHPSSTRVIEERIRHILERRAQLDG
jgi:hypothetical protein